MERRVQIRTGHIIGVLLFRSHFGATHPGFFFPDSPHLLVSRHESRLAPSFLFSFLSCILDQIPQPTLVSYPQKPDGASEAQHSLIYPHITRFLSCQIHVLSIIYGKILSSRSISLDLREDKTNQTKRDYGNNRKFRFRTIAGGTSASFVDVSCMYVV